MEEKIRDVGTLVGRSRNSGVITGKKWCGEYITCAEEDEVNVGEGRRGY